MVLVDRSVCHQGREYKSPYDWCQLNNHHKKPWCRGVGWRNRNCVCNAIHACNLKGKTGKGEGIAVLP